MLISVIPHTKKSMNPNKHKNENSKHGSAILYIPFPNKNGKITTTNPRSYDTTFTQLRSNLKN